MQVCTSLQTDNHANTPHLVWYTLTNSKSRSCSWVIVDWWLKVKVARTRLPSVGFRSWSRFLAANLQVKWVINRVVGCHYFLPGLQLPLQPLRGLLPILLLGGTMGVNSLHKTVTRQHRDCNLNPGSSAPESSTITTRLPSHQLTTTFQQKQ